MQFNIGDKVRFVGYVDDTDKTDIEDVGKIGEVVAIHSEYYVVNHETFTEYFFLPEELKLVERAL